jgi:hypothetical protein
LPTLLRRKVSEVALDRIDDQAPLRLRAKLAQHDQLVADVARKPDADLRVVLDALAPIAGWRASRSPSVLSM